MGVTGITAARKSALLALRAIKKVEVEFVIEIQYPS